MFFPSSLHREKKNSIAAERILNARAVSVNALIRIAHA